jgi:hypothetical protein
MVLAIGVGVLMSHETSPEDTMFLQEPLTVGTGPGPGAFLRY